MWLLNAKEMTLKAFLGRIPPYAILSHTWQQEEVSFQDVILGQASTKAGWKKVELCCQQVIEDGYEWAWIDTCCIDKTSSAELCEAINSMFLWYKKAEVCYAYLEDVYELSEKEGELSLSTSRWYTRGWTLQELIAPQEVMFYTNTWTNIGSRKSLAKQISQITGIHLDLMLGARFLYSYSVAQRMSWAATREMTRPEDQAYSLLGIFDVNMPLLYGEGYKAFGRLQDQIVQKTKELSILAWESILAVNPMLATSLTAFTDCGDVVVSDIVHQRPPPRNIMKSNFYFSMTARVLYTQLHEDDEQKGLVALLGCRREDDLGRVLGLPLDPYSMSPEEALQTNGPLYCVTHIPHRYHQGRLVHVDAIEAAEAEFRDVFVLENDTVQTSRVYRDIRWTHANVRLAQTSIDNGLFSRLRVRPSWPSEGWTDQWYLGLIEGLNNSGTKSGSTQIRFTSGAAILSYSSCRDSLSCRTDKFAKLFFRRFVRYGLRFQYALQLYHQIVVEEDADALNAAEEAQCSPYAESNLPWTDAGTGSGFCSLQWPDGDILTVEL